MIESNIINYIDLGDSLQTLEIYGKTNLIKIFRFVGALLKDRTFTAAFIFILKIFSFLQIMCLSIINISDDDSDPSVKMLKYISDVILLENLITGIKTYLAFVISNFILTLIIIICVIYIFISIHIDYFFCYIPLHVLM